MDEGDARRLGRALAAASDLELVEVQPATVAGHSRSGALDTSQPLFALLDNLDYQDYERLLKDEAFMKQLSLVQGRFKKYMGNTKRRSPLKLGYFCMEYGLHSSLKLYSGGLGVLAGDFLKEASDENVDMVAVGLLYRYRYLRQGLSHYGEQVAHYDPQRFTYLPTEPVRDAEGTWVKIQLDLPERVLYAKLWKA